MDPNELVKRFADKTHAKREETLTIFAAAYFWMTGYLPDEVDLVETIAPGGGSVSWRFVPKDPTSKPDCSARSVDLMRLVEDTIREEMEKASPHCRTRSVLQGVLGTIRQGAVTECMMLKLSGRGRT